MIYIGMVGAANYNKDGVKMILKSIKEGVKNIKSNWQCVLLAPIIILLSPLIIVIMDAMALLRPDSEFIQCARRSWPNMVKVFWKHYLNFASSFLSS